MKSYLVTGAAGFIGSAVARKLSLEGNEVITIDNLSTGFIDNIPNNVRFIEGDCSNPKVVDELGNKTFDTIFHIAGQPGVGTSWDKPLTDINSNVVSTILLLDYARRNNCSTFVYASSMCIYGDVDSLPATEDTELRSKSFYSTGKIASENYMRLYSEHFGIKTTALRLNNVYGPGQNMKNMLQGMISIYLSYAIRDHHIPVYGSKDRFRDFVYIDDVADAFVISKDGREKDLFNVYNVSTGKKTTVEEVIAIIRDNLPEEFTVDYMDKHTLGDQFGIFCSNDKICKTLGWTPNFSVHEGIKKMCQWAIESKEVFT